MWAHKTVRTNVRTEGTASSLPKKLETIFLSFWQCKGKEQREVPGGRQVDISGSNTEWKCFFCLS